ncbi:MAG: hypothetical protein N2C14_14815, partial [Planctomycetales bacterium]
MLARHLANTLINPEFQSHLLESERLQSQALNSARSSPLPTSLGCSRKAAAGVVRFAPCVARGGCVFQHDRPEGGGPYQEIAQ